MGEICLSVASCIRDDLVRNVAVDGVEVHVEDVDGVVDVLFCRGPLCLLLCSRFAL